MTKAILFAFVIGLLALASASLQIAIITPLMGEPYQPSMFVNAVIGSFLIGSPTAFFCFRQSQLLKQTLQALEAAHRQLAASHDIAIQRARYDEMTGMHNRESFRSLFEEQRNRGIAGTMLIIDIDHFKPINDNFGHLTGDQALILVSRAIADATREQDLVGRIGGEEFAAFLPGLGVEAAGKVAERILAAVAGIDFRPSGAGRHSLTVSIGGAQVQPDWAQTMREADKLMYAAKRQGRNCTVMGSAKAIVGKAA